MSENVNVYAEKGIIHGDAYERTPLSPEEEMEIMISRWEAAIADVRNPSKSIDLITVIRPLVEALNDIEVDASVPDDLVIVAKLRQFLYVHGESIDYGGLPVSMAAELIFKQLMGGLNVVRLSQFDQLVERPINAKILERRRGEMFSEAA